jgi:hypothetical protein
MHFRPVPTALALAFACVLGVAPAGAALTWKPYTSAVDGFRATFPGTPTVTSRATTAGANGYRTYAVNFSDVVYDISTFKYVPGTMPVANDAAYRTKLVAYAQGSGCTVRSSRDFKLAGQPALEAICVTASTHLDTLADFLIANDTFYLIVSLGPTGHAKRLEAQTFRNSFALLAPAAPPGSPPPSASPPPSQTPAPSPTATP